MKKILKIVLLTVLLFDSFSFFAQTKLQPYLDAEKARLEEVKTIEKDIQKFISENIKNYDLPEKAVEQIKNNLRNEHITDDHTINGLLLTIKKEELRKLYFEKKPKLLSLYTATPLAREIQCVNGDFEDATNPALGYTFTSQGGQVYIACDDPGNLVIVTAATNDLTQPATIVNNTIIAFDQSLASMPTPVFVPTVSPNAGSQQAIKLNVSSGGNDMTRMTRKFNIGPTDVTLDYEFSLIMEDSGHPNLNDHPYFKVNLFDEDGTLQFSRCIPAAIDCFFNIAPAKEPDHDLYYTDWMCEQIDVSNLRGQQVTLQFIIADCNQGGHFGTVYIDNICGNQCPKPNLGAIILSPLQCQDFESNPTYQVCGTLNNPLASYTFNGMTISMSQNGGAFSPISGAILSFSGDDFCFTFDSSEFGSNPAGNVYQFWIQGNYTLACSDPVDFTNQIYASIDFRECCQPTLVTSGTISTAVHEERSDWIRSTNTVTYSGAVGTGVVYHAENFVELLPGFEAEYGSQFAAYPQGCTANYIYRTPNQTVSNENVEYGPAKLVKANNGFSIIPNPSNGVIEILMQNAKFNKVSITSIDGKVVFESNAQSNDKLNVDVSPYENGIYIVSVFSDDGQLFTKKLIKN